MIGSEVMELVANIKTEVRDICPGVDFELSIRDQGDFDVVFKSVSNERVRRMIGNYVRLSIMKKRQNLLLQAM